MIAIAVSAGMHMGISPEIAFTGPLDSYTTNLVAAWSAARRLLTSYEGALVRLRRSSDNAEQDLNPLTNGALDTSSGATFVSSGDGFARYLYDQSGNTKHLGNATGSAQPKLFSSGSVVAGINGKPSARFDGVDDKLTAVVSTSSTRTIYIVAVKRSAPSATSKVLLGQGTDASAVVYSNSGTGSGYLFYSNSVGGVASLGGTPAAATVFVFNGNATSVTTRANGAETSFVGTSNIYNTTAFCLGNNSAGAFPADYDICEALFYSVAHDSTTRAAIESILASYYGITIS